MLKGKAKKFKGTGLLDYDFGKLYSGIESLDESYNNVLKKTIKESAENVRLELKKQVSKGQHYYSGNTKESLQNKNEVKVENLYAGKITCEVGFKRSEGGAVAYWLERGTPRMKAYKIISKSTKNTDIKNILAREMSNKLMKQWNKGRK